MTEWDHRNLVLNDTGIFTAVCELPEGLYAPPFDLKDKTVLDVGATCGEVAAWYLQIFHASRVICVEINPKSLPFLRKNAESISIEVVEEPFSVDHIRRFKPDFIKCDVEGYEMLLLEFQQQGGVLPPCVIEAHTNWVRDQFLKAGFKVIKCTNDTLVQVAAYIMTNYESLGFKK